MRNALDIFYIMLMLNLPSSEPSEALVKIRVRNQLGSETTCPKEKRKIGGNS